MEENYVDEIYNEHLNIFRFYRQKRDVENNFSRVLARLLIEDRYDKFHQFILNEINIDKKIKDIVYQRNLNTIKRTIDKYDRGNSNIRKCVPVMLYGSNPKLDLSQTEENTDESKKIPDITLIFDDTIVFIEVKLDDVKPKHQVENQAKGYKKINVNVNRKMYKNGNISVYKNGNIIIYPYNEVEVPVFFGLIHNLKLYYFDLSSSRTGFSFLL